MKVADSDVCAPVVSMLRDVARTRDADFGAALRRGEVGLYIRLLRELRAWADLEPQVNPKPVEAPLVPPATGTAKVSALEEFRRTRFTGTR